MGSPLPEDSWAPGPLLSLLRDDEDSWMDVQVSFCFLYVQTDVHAYGNDGLLKWPLPVSSGTAFPSWSGAIGGQPKMEPAFSGCFITLLGWLMLIPGPSSELLSVMSQQRGHSRRYNSVNVTSPAWREGQGPQISLMDSRAYLTVMSFSVD